MHSMHVVVVRGRPTATNGSLRYPKLCVALPRRKIQCGMATARSLLGGGEIANKVPVVNDHEQARTVQRGSLQGGDSPLLGRILLHDKRCPTEDQPAAERAAAWVTSYGPVEIAAFRAKLDLQPDDYFTEEGASRDNVVIKRPFHDRLGVGKVVFIFSDDGATPQVCGPAAAAQLRNIPLHRYSQVPYPCCTSRSCAHTWYD